MKIFHLHPKYLDNTTLYSEFSLLRYSFSKINDGEVSLSEHDRISEKFANHHQFIFIRLYLVANELEKRGIINDFDYKDYIPEILTDEEYEIEEELIQADIDILYSIWREYIKYDSDISGLIEQLALTSVEEIYEEMINAIKKTKKEYGL